MSFLDNVFSGVATALKTLTGAVTISQSPAPTPGQVLTAINATNAAWANAAAGPGGGGDGVGFTDAQVITATGPLSAVLGTMYYLANNGIDVQMPAFTAADNGKAVLLLVGGVKTNLVAPPGGFVIMGRGVPPAQISSGGSSPLTGPAVYIVRAFFAAAFPAPICLVEGRDIPTRQDQDHTVVVLSIPADAVYTSHSGGRFTLEASPTGTERLVYDIDTADTNGFDPLDIPTRAYTVIMPMGPGGASFGTGRLIRDNSETDWQIEGLRSNPNLTDLLGNSKAHYRAVHGNIYRGRIWETEEVESQHLKLLRAPLEVYPHAGEGPLTGVGDPTAHGLQDNQILIGRVNRTAISLSESPTFNLLMLAPLFPDDHVGERFAIMNEDAASASAVVQVDASQTIFGPNELLSGGNIVTVFMKLGTYVEWQLFPGGVWRAVCFIEGAEPA